MTSGGHDWTTTKYISRPHYLFVLIAIIHRSGKAVKNGKGPGNVIMWMNARWARRGGKGSKGSPHPNNNARDLLLGTNPDVPTVKSTQHDWYETCSQV